MTSRKHSTEPQTNRPRPKHAPSFDNPRFEEPVPLVRTIPVSQQTQFEVHALLAVATGCKGRGLCKDQPDD